MSIYGYGDHVAAVAFGTDISLDLRRPIRLAISGLMGSGKTWAADSAAQQLREKWNRQVWRTSFGDECRREWMRRRGIDPESVSWPRIPTEELQQLSVELSGPDGLGLVARLFEVVARHHLYDDIIFDGGRRRPELEALRAAGFQLVWMDSPEKLRLERLLYRNRDPNAAVGVWHRLMHHPLEEEAHDCYRSGMFDATWPNMWRPPRTGRPL